MPSTMHDDRSHPLLAQIPLTVSPFISLPTATTLPYTYKTLPSTLPTSSTGSTIMTVDGQPKYVVSSTGHAAHPDEIIASCRALQAYIQKVQDDADRELKAWDEQIQARELAEKRRVAPGWLDSDARILEPERLDGRGTAQGAVPISQVSLMDADAPGQSQASGNDAGAELDKAFGGFGLS